MNLNLATAYGALCSPPQRPELAFYSLTSEDLLFNAGETIEIRCLSGLRSVALNWTLARNALTTPFRTGKATPLPGNRFSIPIETEGLHPGFYDLRVTLYTGAEDTIQGVCVFGWRVDEMVTPSTRPEDFYEFWAEAKAEADGTPLDPRDESEERLFQGEEIDSYNTACAALPKRYDPEGVISESVLSKKISVSAPDGGRVFGWLAKPEGNGPFPAMLVLPGAGFNARPRPLEHARHGYLALDIQVHGQDVCLDSYPALPGCQGDQDFSAPENYYYYRVHQRVLQAINYLDSRDDVDSSRIVVVGGSQGGRLSTVAAGIDKRVRAAVPAIAHFGNQPYLAWSQSCNEAGTDGMDVAGPPVGKNEQARCVAYYDPMNFAEGITCPVMMNAGLIDPVSQASHVMAVYNRLGCEEKSMVALPGLGHDWCAEFDRRAWRWLAKQLG
ncbi:MAG: acetylxylan esterase [Planctomycetota bacterium]|jgi:cephalosporin-C deacetylase-like acetyl esterase